MKPTTRIESLLAQIEGNTSGNAVELDIAPVTKIEKYLASIAANTASGGGGLIINEDADTHMLDKTWQEIYDAVSTGGAAVIFSVTDTSVDYMPVSHIDFDASDDYYAIAAGHMDGYNIAAYNYIATSASGYPVLD